MIENRAIFTMECQYMNSYGIYQMVLFLTIVSDP